MTKNERFIPAPAGNSHRADSAHGRNTVHPRACGEQRAFCIRGLLSIGSSPRLRGTAARI